MAAVMAPLWAQADQPAARSDRNSQLAHQQLLAKAKAGHIDVYFEGDSITRRWGATDYPQLLANWTRNFFGWNAADFGWGADRIENILWRLENGELDGVHPKVIVLLAGTNNVGNRVPATGIDAAVEDITRGLQAVVRTMQAKAPEAVIVLMGIFPRNDNMDVMPEINGINANLAKMADGRKIRYLNINAQLADADGRLHEGMMNADKLHPAVAGYQVWADALKPLFTELLGPPSKEDLAPGATADPSAVLPRPVIDAKTEETPIPPSYFGLHVNRIMDDPTVPFGTLRLWDDGTNWKRLNQAKGRYDFSNLDRWIEFAQRHHAELIYACGHTPNWATRGGTDLEPPRDLRDWEDFITAIAKHAGGRIKYWEMWNEPNAPNFWRGSIMDLVTMTQHARRIILSIDPAAKILSPAPAGGNGESSKAVSWLNDFFKAGGGQFIDIVAFHGYLPGKPPESIVTTLKALRKIMLDNAVKASEIWDTESSWGRIEDLPDLEQQADFEARHFLLHWSAGATRNCFYGWDSGRWGGLTDRATGQQRPAARAYAEMYKWMVGARMTQPCLTDENGIWTCRFTRPGGYQALAVWNPNGESSYRVGAPYQQVRDLSDATKPVQNGRIVVGRRPLLLENRDIPPQR